MTDANNLPEVPADVDPLAAGSPADPRLEGTPPVNPADPSKPGKQGMFAGKFDTVEDLEQGYVQLVKRLGQRQLESTPATPATPATPGTPPADPSASMTEPSMTAPSPAGIDGILQRAGVTSDQIAEEWRENNGALTPETYKGFEKAGFARDAVDAFIHGQLATVRMSEVDRRALRQRAEAMVGGGDQFNNLLHFKNSLPESVRDDLNARLEDPVRWEGAVLELQGRQRTAIGAGRSNDLIQPTGAPSLGPTGASSPSELQSLMKQIPPNGDLSQVDPAVLRKIQATPDEIFTQMGRTDGPAGRK